MIRLTSFCSLFAVAAYLCACSSEKALLGESESGGITSTGGAVTGGATGGASTTGGTTFAGGAKGSGGSAGSVASGGTSALSLSAACGAICAVTTQLSCVTPSWCASSCTGYTDNGADFPQQEYLDMMDCIAQNLTSVSDYVCSAPGSFNEWSPKANPQCESLVCAWTCADATYVDINVYARCLCT